MKPRVKTLEFILQFLPVLLPCNTINTRRGTPPKLQVRIPESIDRHMVEQSGELGFLIPSCYLSHTLQLTWRTSIPTLRSGCVLLVRVLLGRVPSLQRFRDRNGGVVRRLLRYYALVRLPLFVHHRVMASAFPMRPVCRGQTVDLPVPAQ
jgi:hypothetical protein